MADYISSLTGVQMDAALIDMAEHNSEAWAVGERNGIPVDSEDVTYQNNAQYYASQAQSIAPASVTEAVRWDIAQTALTDAQRARGRANINAADNDTSVQVVTQTFTSAQQEIARANIAAGSTNPNLLDNPFFTVNQRSASGTVTQPNYGVDRWRVNGTTGATISFATGQVTLPASGTELLQILPIEAVEMGSTVTLSVRLADGTIVSGTETIASSYSANTYVINTTVDGVRLRFTYRTNGVWHINFAATDSTAHIITAAKLEKGSVSTLANDAPPNYAEELAKCQYYCRVLTASSLSMAAVGMAVAATEFRCAFPFVMRTMPTVTFSGTIQGNTSAVSAISTNGTYSGATSAVALRFTTTGLTAPAPVILYIGEDAKIVLSADL